MRIATYNVHKCRGMDRRVDVVRVADVIAVLDADVVALQEVLHGDGSTSQARIIAGRLRYHFSFGENRIHAGAPYGNATLSRFPIVLERNYDLTWRKRERRGCLRTDVQLPDGGILHVFNVHLGTSFFERPHQARRLLEDALADEDPQGPRIVVGDFNEWTRGVATRLMRGRFESVDARLTRRSFPGVLPMFQLDHFYFDESLALSEFRIERGRKAKVASDHLPLVAEFTAAEEKKKAHGRSRAPQR